MLAGLKEVINAQPKLNKHKVLRSDFIDKGYYYNEKEAKAFIPHLDLILEDKEDRELRYEDYPQWSPNTLWAKVNQAFKFVVDNLDKEGKYTQLRNCLKISRGEFGILFHYVENYNPSGEWILHKVRDSKKMVENYKTKVYKFMEESSEGEELDIKEGIALNDDEVSQLKDLLSESPIFMAYVSNNRIKIIHTKQETENENTT